MALRRRVTALLSAATLTTGLAVVPAIAASADISDCSVSASLPSKLRISSTRMDVTAAVSDPGFCTDWADWNIDRGDGAQTASIYATTDGDQQWTLYTNLYGSDGGPGSYTAVWDDGYDTNYDTILGDDSNTMVAKFASKMSAFHATRSHGAAHLSVKVSRYTHTNGKYGTAGWGAWKSAAVKFQYKSGTTWRTAKTVHSSKAGKATATIKKGRHVWRAVVVDTGTTWGLTSGSHAK